MIRLSFGHTLFASFLLIAAILGTAALGSLRALEAFATGSRANASHALDASTAVQQLGERTVDMERSARQFLVLADRSLRDRFETARRHALDALDALAPQATPGTAQAIDAWRTDAGRVAASLADGSDAATSTQALTQLAIHNEVIARNVRRQLDDQARAQLDTLEANRAALARYLVVAVLAAVALAMLTGWWVLRPLRRVERAIRALGESRFGEPIEIDGPSDLRQVGQQLDWLRRRLSDLEANRTRVLQHVSHELKTPLASLREGTALLDDGVVGTLTADQREVVDILKHNLRTLQERIEGLLGYNAAIFDARRLHRRPIEPRTLVEEVIAEQQLSIQTRNLHVRIEGHAPALLADADKLRIAVGNLLANAISFSPPRGEIRLRLSAPDGILQIDCIDQGPGANPDEAARLFEPFFQGSRPPPQPRQGSGLGLSIVQAFVTAHGGRVQLLGDGPGAHFRMELPYGA